MDYRKVNKATRKDYYPLLFLDQILLNTVRGVHSFLGHVGFCRRFIKDFSKIKKPLCKLSENKMQHSALMKHARQHLRR